MSNILLLKKSVNLSLIFLFSYFTVHILYLLFTFALAYLIDLPDVTFYFAYIDYNIEAFTNWSKLKIVLLYGFPNLMMLLSAIIFWVAMKKLSFKYDPKMKNYLLLSMVTCLAFVIGNFIAAPYTAHGIAVVASWYYIKKEVLFIVCTLFWIAIPVIGWCYSKTFMRAAYSRSFLSTKWTRIEFLANTFLLPFMLVSFFMALLLILYPGYNLEYYFSIDFIRVFSLFGILIFIMIFNFNKRYISISSNRELERINYTLFFVGLISLAIIYLSLFIV
ncbi:MAG: hypothetical protein ISR01_03160 [Chitinophagales bacterium]|nr:hypothetical protein [Chitinophagales bacterium]